MEKVKFNLITAFFLLLFVFTGVSNSTTMLGEENDVVNSTWTFHDISSGLYYQSFISAYNNIVGASFFLSDREGDTNGEVTISLYDTIGNTAIASGTVTASENTWAEVSFSLTALTVGTEYYLLVQSDSSFYSNYSNGDAYANGTIYNSSGGVWESGESPRLDMTFRTYYDDGYDGGQVPEPATAIPYWYGLNSACRSWPKR